MMTTLSKATLGIALLTLTPLAAMVSGSAFQAQAGGYVSGNVVVGGPNFSVGFSYGNPYVVGPVHAYPVAYPVAPVYYYPAYGVYPHYYPAYSYNYYAPRPVVYGPVAYGHAYGGQWYANHPAHGCNLNHYHGRGYGQGHGGGRYHR